MNVNVNVNLNTWDLVRFNIWHHWFRTVFGKIAVAASLLAIILYALESWFGISIGLIPHTKPHQYLYLPGIWLLGIPLIAAIQHFLSKRSNPGLSVFEYCFTDENIKVISESYTGSDFWTLYAKIVETKADYYFYINDRQARIIPKRALSTQQCDALRTLIKQKVAPNKIQIRC